LDHLCAACPLKAKTNQCYWSMAYIQWFSFATHSVHPFYEDMAEII